MHATRRHFKKCKALVGEDPLNRIAADSKMFPAGMFFIKGWLFLLDADESSYLLSYLTSA